RRKRLMLVTSGPIDCWAYASPDPPLRRFGFHPAGKRFAPRASKRSDPAKQPPAKTSALRLEFPSVRALLSPFSDRRSAPVPLGLPAATRAPRQAAGTRLDGLEEQLPLRYSQ